MANIEEQKAAILKKIGTKYEVFNGLAEKTSGGLHKENLCENAAGKIVSKSRHEQGKKAFKNLEKFRDQKKLQSNANSDAVANNISEAQDLEIKKELEPECKEIQLKDVQEEKKNNSNMDHQANMECNSNPIKELINSNSNSNKSSSNINENGEPKRGRGRPPKQASEQPNLKKVYQ